MELPLHPNEDDEREQKEHNDKFLRAMRIIFAWAKKWEESTPLVPAYHRYLSRVDGAPVDRWKAFIDNKVESFGSPELACIATAEYIVRLDPTITKGLSG